MTASGAAPPDRVGPQAAVRSDEPDRTLTQTPADDTAMSRGVPPNDTASSKICGALMILKASAVSSASLRQDGSAKIESRLCTVGIRVAVLET